MSLKNVAASVALHILLPGPTSPGRGCGRARRRLQDAMPVTAQIRWAARPVDRSGAPAASATPAEIRKSEGDPRNHLRGRGAQPAARPVEKDSTECALWRCGSNALIFPWVHLQEAERWPTSRASPSATSAHTEDSRKEKRQGLQVQHQSPEPAFSPNWMTGSVLTTTIPVMTTNPAIPPVRSGPNLIPKTKECTGVCTCMRSHVMRKHGRALEHAPQIWWA